MRTLRSAAILASVLLLLFTVGCRGGRTILNMTNVPVLTQKANPTLEEVGKAIIRAGVNTNWRLIELKPGQLTGTRSMGNHSAMIDVTYTTTNYNITFKESTLGNPETGVHRVYNQWIQELDTQIRSQLHAI